MFERMGASDKQVGGAGGTTTFKGLLAADQVWEKVRNGPYGAAAGPAPRFVQDRPAHAALQGARTDYDVVVCGGTLGIFIACALQLRGLRVAVLERGQLAGRAQEWNISRSELAELVEQGVLTQDEVEEAIRIEFNPNRCAFHGDRGAELFTEGILNLGVSPAMLVAAARARFEAAGGVTMEKTALEGVTVHSDCALLSVPDADAVEGGRIAAGLVLDCMGHASPIVRQDRWGQRPDGICLVVGTVASGFPEERNKTSDVIATVSDIQGASPATRGSRVTDAQYFWEAFPAGSGPTDRTTYMFAYLDADPGRPRLLDMFEDYWELMPAYQGVDLDALAVQRALFGFFPTYRDSPLTPGHDRILQVGDASGIQSPLSFGGFGALTRHLPRITNAIVEAHEAGALDKESLARINAYNPGLSAAWLFQRAMSVRVGQRVDPEFVNRLMGGSFQVLRELGDPATKPFLQDVLQMEGLLKMLAGQMAKDPAGIPGIMAHLGPAPLADWLGHMGALGAYTALHKSLGGPLRDYAVGLPPKQRFELRRMLDAWEYGSGLDYRG
ncbi:unnamed protein product [Pedinophyceae sp. YPF-701]|nr:unnamed protein product [Pedinophyceae sp. YPF-701]